MEKSRFYEKMTNQMKAVYDETMNAHILKEEFLYCNKMYITALETGKISFPCNTEDGIPVVHGARREIDIIRDYWLRRRDLVKKFLPPEWVELQNVSSIVYYR